MAVTEQALMDALKAVVDPNTGKDFVSGKTIRNLSVQDGDVSFDVELGYPAKSQIPGFRKALIGGAMSSWSGSSNATGREACSPGTIRKSGSSKAWTCGSTCFMVRCRNGWRWLRAR